MHQGGEPPCALGSRGARLPERRWSGGARLMREIQRGARLLLAGVHGAGEPLPSRAGREGLRHRRKLVAYYSAWLAAFTTSPIMPLSALSASTSFPPTLGNEVRWRGRHHQFRQSRGMWEIYQTQFSCALAEAGARAESFADAVGNSPQRVARHIRSGRFTARPIPEMIAAGEPWRSNHPIRNCGRRSGRCGCSSR
jgi:hypothetical protein